MEKELFEITAKEITVEVRDEATGEVFRRELPVDSKIVADYRMLKGDKLAGRVSQLVFDSPRGLGRMSALIGKGPDKDPCGGHSH